MTKRLFLTGAMDSAKSDILRGALGDKLACAGGFVTDTALDENGGFVGMQLRPAAAAAGIEGFEAEIFIDCRSFPARHDNEVFRNTGVKLLKEAQMYPFALLDEIGGYETVIPQYRAALYELFESGLPCVGTLKKPEEADMMREFLGLGERVNEHIAALWAYLENDGETTIINIDDSGREETEAAVKAWMKEV